MSDGEDDLLKLVKDALVILDIYQGDLGRIAFYSKDQIDRGVAEDGRVVAAWWITRAERALGLSASDLLNKNLGASPLGPSLEKVPLEDAETALDVHVGQLLKLYAQGGQELQAHVVGMVKETIKENLRLRRRIRTFQERSKKAKLKAERAKFIAGRPVGEE